MKSFPRSLILASVVLAMAALPAASFAADSTAASAASPAMKKATKFPFHGKLKAVDVGGMTFTLESATPRVFNVTADTKIKKNGAPATLKDAVVGEDVGGYTEKSADGKLTALSVRFGPRVGAKTEAAEATPAPATGGVAAATPTPKAKKMKKSKASPSPSPST